ncbi:MAG: HAD-IB family phosphatase [Bacteroidota bacterium]|nr:HAD-IB family phosphatase [Bacteroidota bacterium]MDP4247906.1 HAD-IB family phosphatase [Bacteroidota bacterium]MDP4260157.1 HAD-IB family phosphatase [Bacteroidota bacterium]
MISVIIPTLNEEKTIARVIRETKRNQLVSEIIVVDDLSTDNTVAEAQKENIRIITSTHIGKGYAMREGMLIAENEILVFLDPAIPNFTADIINKLAAPLIQDEADFVKSYFERQTGRVAEIMVKPMLEFFFPHLLHYSQPLSRMIAGKKSLFQKVEFDNDAGVDIGLLIDMHHLQARIKEVCIGEVEVDAQPLHALGRMAKQVANAIFKRVNIFDSGRRQQEEESTQMMREQVEFALKEVARNPKKMIVFDIDHTLIQGSWIQAAAEKFGFKRDLDDILSRKSSLFIQTQKIARLLEGRSFAELIHVLESIPLIGDAVQVVRELQSRGYVCGIISDGFHVIANHIKNMLGLDFTLGNELEFHKSVATGEVKIPSQLLHDRFSRCEHEHCLSNMFQYILHRFGISLSDTVAVGSLESDICMVKMADKGVALNSTSGCLDEAADYVFRAPSLKPLLEVAR